LRILPDSYPIAWDSRAASVDSGRKQHPSCYGKFYPLFLKQGAYSSINDRPALGILPHEPPHGTCRIQDSARSPSPSGLADLVNFPRRLAFHSSLSISRLVSAAPPKVGPTISAIWERRELENPSTRRAPKLLEDLPRAGLPASASFLEAASLTLWSLTDA
jgi:hypothetical protein